jgi:hypothetical protein
MLVDKIWDGARSDLFELLDPRDNLWTSVLATPERGRQRPVDVPHADAIVVDIGAMFHGATVHTSAKMLEGIVARPGLYDLLSRAALTGVPLAVVTSIPAGELGDTLSARGLPAARLSAFAAYPETTLDRARDVLRKSGHLVVVGTADFVELLPRRGDSRFSDSFSRIGIGPTLAFGGEIDTTIHRVSDLADIGMDGGATAEPPIPEGATPPVHVYSTDLLGVKHSLYASPEGLGGPGHAGPAPAPQFAPERVLEL